MESLKKECQEHHHHSIEPSERALMMALKRVWVRGVGSYVPQRVITNDELSQTLDTSDEWIYTRTGIRQRHVAADGELTSDLAVNAAQKALENAGVEACEIDLIILATTTADHVFPATATRVQQRLGTQGAAFDMNAVCGGFLFALATAEAYLKTGLAKRALVIGAETMTRLLDWQDRTTAVLFGDGAGAFVLEGARDTSSSSHNTEPLSPTLFLPPLKGDGGESHLKHPEKQSVEKAAQDGSRYLEPGPCLKHRGFLGHVLKTDGRGYEELYVNGGVGCGKIGTIQMNGRQVFKRAVQELVAVSRDILEKYQIKSEDIDHVVPHQANKRIIEAVLSRLNISPQKAYLNVDRYANTSAASIPIAFDEAVSKGIIQRGELVLMQAFAAGFAWGASVLRF